MGKRGAPTTFTKAIGQEICARISQGETLADICRDTGINRGTVDKWRGSQPEFNAAYLEARTKGYDVIAESCLAIADDARNDWMEREGHVTVNGEHIQRSKLRIETRLKLLAKWDPRRYGDKHILAGDPENPVEHNVNVAPDEAYLRMLGAKR